eukprot:14148427-Ditylum_brightwellii.AAC.1
MDLRLLPLQWIAPLMGIELITALVCTFATAVNPHRVRQDGVDDSDDSGDKHLTHLSQAFDCCLTERSDPNMCVYDGKEGVDNNDDNRNDNNDDGGDMHLAHLTQLENNVNIGACDKHLTNVVKNTPESLRSDVT